MNPIRTLIADDYPFFRRALKAHLEENCMAVVAGMAANGPDAAAFADELAPDFVIMKIQLPGLGGLEVCRRIKARNPNITIMLYTPYGSEMYAGRGEFCADAYIPQNSMFDELPLKISGVISQETRG